MVGLVYLNEFIEVKHQTLVIAILNVVDALPLFFQALYYMFVPNWIYLHMVGIVGVFILLMLLVTIPESPKYFYANRRYDETR